MEFAENAVASGGCGIRDLPPSKRFKYVSSHLGSTPCLPLPAKKRVFPPVSFCLPAKKRAYALPAAAEGTVPVCLPAKKRAYAPSLDAIVPACLPAKKRVCGPPPDTDASACVPAKKRVHALAPPPEDAAASHCIPAKKRVQAPPPPEDDAASVPVSLPANKRVMPPFIPPSPSPSIESDGARVATVKEARPQGATNPRVANGVGDYARAEASKMPDKPIKPKEVKEQVSMKSRGANAAKRTKDLECKKSCNVVNVKQPEVQVEVFKKAEEAIDPTKLAREEESRKEAKEVARERKQEEVEEEDDGVHCAVCGSTDGDPSDPIVFCDGCDLMVHASCYGNPLAQSIPDGDWFCSLCSAKGKPARPGCCLCPGKGGAMKRTTDGRWAHISCALLVPEVFFRDPDGRDGIDCSRVPGHRFTKECYICESSRGCALECSQPKCGLGFHVSCGLKGGLCIEYREAKGGAVVAGFCREHSKLWEKQQLTGKYKIVSRGHE